MFYLEMLTVLIVVRSYFFWRAQAFIVGKLWVSECFSGLIVIGENKQKTTSRSGEREWRQISVLVLSPRKIQKMSTYFV